MTAATVLQDAARLGVALRAQGDLIVARPRETLTPELAASIHLHRAAILAARALAVQPPSKPCWNCKSRRFFARPERLTWICASCHPPADPDVMVWHDVAEALNG